MSGSSGTATCARGANQGAIKRGRRLPYSLLFIAILLGTTLLYKGGDAGFPPAQPRSQAQWAHLYAALPLSFEVNRGQTHSSVDFLSRGQGYTLFLTGRESVLALQALPPRPANAHTSPISDASLRMRLLGANAHPSVTGADQLPGKANYFIGNDPAKWRTNIPTYAKVRYRDVYPGVDLVYYGTRDGRLEYDFVVAPGANPEAIHFALSGTQRAAGAQPVAGNQNRAAAESKPESLRFKIASGGDLVVQLANGDVRFHKPVVYQEGPAAAKALWLLRPAAGQSASRRSGEGQKRQHVDGQYVLQAGNQVRFKLGPYDHSRPLVIDPVLVYATYVGGSGGDIGYAIGVDTSFDAYIAGVTNSTNFPTSGSPEQSSSQGNGDAFVTKINSTGTALLYSTYLGGTGSDTATAMAVFAGSVFLTGNTTSVDFPTVVPVSTANPFQKIYGGGTDAFVTQLNATGSSLVYSSYLGGSGADFGQGIAVDSSGNAYVTGSTQSGDFPVLNAYQSGNNGSSDAFVTKVNPTGEALVYSTYLGGTSADVGQSIQLDSAGDAYVAGYTFSTNFPLVGAYQGTLGGGADAFVTELNPSGSALTFSTFLGGSGDDRAYGIALDSSKNVYITGATGSANFPTTNGVFQPALKGASDAFVSKISSNGASLVYSTYLGGSGVDQANGIAVTSAGIAYVTGFTESTDFPTQSPVQSVLGLSNNQLCGTSPCADAFVTQLNAAGTALTYSTYLGGNGPDFGQSIAVDSTGDPYITGSTSSTNFPAISPPNSVSISPPPYKSTLTGTAGNAFIAKLDPGTNPNISIVPYSLNFANETLSVTSPYQQITLSNMSTVPLTITSILVGLVGNSSTIFTVPNYTSCVGTLSPGGGSCILDVAFTPASTGQVTDTITLTDNAGGTAGTEQTITLTGTGVTAATAVTVTPTSLSFPSQSVGTTSAAQNVTLTNTGSQTLSITKIAAGTTNDFSETDNCLTAPYFGVLGVSQSCSISVYFSPTASGTRTASLTISDNATGSPQAVSLTGIGAAAFTLTTPSAVNPTLIGSTQTTFTIVANGPTSFNGAISLACSAGSTCAFSPPSIFVGGSSTMTISNLSPSTTNPYPFTVTGTSGTQTYNLQLSLGFEDYTLTASPTSDTIQAGTTAKYTINVNPINGFDSEVLLSCYTGLPPASQCNFSNSMPVPNGTSPTAITLDVSTQKYVAPTSTLPRFPGGKLPPLILGLLSLAALASLGLGRKRGRRQRWLGVRLALLSVVLALDLALVACRPSTLEITGTTVGNYTITIEGVLNSNTAVIRSTTLNLSVTTSVP